MYDKQLIYVQKTHAAAWFSSAKRFQGAVNPRHPDDTQNQQMRWSSVGR
jgi:hypothetical protein